ncbi:MAG TPA: GNAT family N-acetyltransferase [Pyrinomonadaceae bacterium]|nr:GNAT family N-acetyltransferase [Pyrinomonadaceae bacterium]
MDGQEIAKVLYREATAADCQAVAEVHVRSWRESYSGIVPQSFLDKMSVEQRAQAFARGFTDDSYKMYVAEVPEKGIVGFADFGELREGSGAFEAELYALYLLSEFQRKGIGEKLFRQVVEALVRRGQHSMLLLTLEVSPYRTFYEKMGGRVRGRKQIALEGLMFDALFYGWEDLRRCL